MTELQEELIQAIEEDCLYDWIASNYWKLSKEELKDIILELDYALYVHQIEDSVIVAELISRFRL